MSNLNDRNKIAGGPCIAIEDDIILQLARGRTGALEDLYRRTSSAVYGYALSILRDPAAAEDVMQDTYVHIMKSASGYQPSGRAMAWILTITRNLALMSLRKFENKNLSIEEVFHLEDENDSYRQSNNRMVLEALLRTLAADEREIVMLHAISGLKHREIAELLSIPPATVISKYNRALAKLRTRLGGDDID